MAKWFVSAKKADFNGIGEKYHISPVLARIIRNRDIVEDSEIERYLHGSMEDVYDGGLMKDMEIYNIFDTDKILNRPPEVAISNTSGLAGIAYWINKHFDLPDGEVVTKQSPIVIKVKEEIDRLYDDGRTTVMGNDELMQIIDFY